MTKNAEIHTGIDRVWNTLIDTEKEQEYWANIRDIRVLSTNGSTIEREATVGPSGFSQRSRQTLVLEPKRSLKLTMTGDRMTGERTIVLVPMGKNSTRVDVTWNFELKDAPRFVQGIVKNQISKVTDKALAKIAEDAERTTS